MKNLCLSLLIAVVFLAACTRRDDVADDVSLGNGFLLRSYGMTIELHPAQIALWVKMDKHVTLIWPSLNSSCGGPILIEKGILFTALNQESKDAVFVADERGIVADITSYILEMNKGKGILQIKKVENKVQIDLWDSTVNRTIVLTSVELMQLAKKVISNGSKVRWDKVSFYK